MKFQPIFLSYFCLIPSFTLANTLHDCVQVLNKTMLQVQVCATINCYKMVEPLAESPMGYAVFGQAAYFNNPDYAGMKAHVSDSLAENINAPLKDMPENLKISIARSFDTRGFPAVLSEISPELPEPYLREQLRFSTAYRIPAATTLNYLFIFQLPYDAERSLEVYQAEGINSASLPDGEYVSVSDTMEPRGKYRSNSATKTTNQQSQWKRINEALNKTPFGQLSSLVIGLVGKPAVYKQIVCTEDALASDEAISSTVMLMCPYKNVEYSWLKTFFSFRFKPLQRSLKEASNFEFFRLKE